jgi:hypothetical protein
VNQTVIVKQKITPKEEREEEKKPPELQEVSRN